MTQSESGRPLLIERRRKRPAIAGLLSLLPGLGQVYVGYYRRGFIHTLVAAAVITVLSSKQAPGMTPLFGMFLTFFWLYSIIDAVRLANLYNDALAGLGPDDLRHELVLMGNRGSILGGSALILGGFLYLLHRVFGVPMDWLKDWWPAVPVGFGIYLLVQGLREKKARNP
ncbi:MAG: hypothetical protein FJY88_04525 [Candidatus Eisenbacteria bacterium]|nr:hypothetical protein [Candidatus Eisenbacteria bacterium]